MGKISLGNNEIQRISLGTLEIQKVSVGLSEIWSTAASPVRMGMTLSADFTPGSVGTSYWFTPTGFVSRAGFPDTVLPGSGVFNLPAGSYKISTRVVRTQDYQSRGIRVKDSGGNVLATIQDQYFNPNELVNVAFTHPGGNLTVEIMNESSFNSAHIIRTGTLVEVMPAALPTLQGVLLSGTQSISANTYTLLPMSTADVEHPGSAVFTNGIKIVGDGPVTVKCYARMANANTSGNKFQMYKNGSPIAGSEFTANPAAQTAQWGGTFTHTFANNDVLQMYGYSTGLVSNRREFTGDNTKANTYFELMP